MINSTKCSVIVDVALGFIAFSIGGEFKISNLKKIGKSVVIITLFQSLLALVFVDVSLIVLCSIMGTIEQNLPLILVLGAISTATAPAATLLVIRQYKARGKFTDTLLLVVALDDAFGLIFFSISFALAKVYANGQSLTVTSVLLNPLIEISASLGLGAVIGLILALAMKVFKSRANRLICCIAAVILAIALIKVIPIDLSSLLVCMMIGGVFANFCPNALQILDGTDRWTPPLFMLFFIVSSAELDINVIPTVGLVGITYLVFRSLGKYFGAFLGGQITHEDKAIRNYLGLALLPQAGVAIGMAKLSAETLTAYSSQILAVVLCATLIYELTGPLCTKYSLAKAGEISVETKKPVSQPQ